MRKIENEVLPLFILVVVVTILFRNIVNTYAFTDVYEFLYNSTNTNFTYVFIMGGRPLYALLNKSFLTSVSSVEQLSYLRLFGVTGLLATSIILFYLLKGVFNARFSLICVFFVVFSPGANLIGIWAATFQLGWAIALALVGGYLANEFLSQKEIKKNWLYLICAIILGIMSLMLYQPAVTAFVIPGFIYFLSKKDLKSTFYFLIIYFTIYAFYFFSNLLVLHLVNLPPLERAGLTGDPIGNLLWFFNRPLKSILVDNFLFYNTGLRIAVLLFFLFLLFFSLFQFLKKCSFKKILVLLLFLICFLFACYVPNLVSADLWVSNRTLITLFIFKWVIIFYGFRSIKNHFKFLFPSLLFLGFVLFCNAWYNINQGFIHLQKTELTMMKTRIRELTPLLKNKEALVIITPEFYFLDKQKIVRRVVNDEFGLLSTAQEWVPIPMIRQILHEQGEYHLEENLMIHQFSSTERDKIKDLNDIPLIDIEQLFLKSYDPLF